MTALSGGEQLDDELTPLNSVLERPDRGAGEARRGPRSLDEIFPLRGDVTRSRQMQETWRAFGSEMEDAVRSALDTSRSPPEIAYAIGGIVHNYFRTRGVTLTSYELRRLVAELLALRQRAEPAPPLVHLHRRAARRRNVVDGRRAAARRDRSCPMPCSRPAVAAGRPGATRLRCRAVGCGDGQGPCRACGHARGPCRARGGSGGDRCGARRGPPGEPERRDRLARLALSELCGLGPIDRIWADPSIRAVFVNGPAAIYVERNGVLEPSPERFRDQAHLAELVGRLVRRPSSDAVLFRLRDGREGMVIFPPAAPAGPVLVAAPRRAGQRDLRASDRRGHARSGRWPTCCASPRAAG